MSLGAALVPSHRHYDRVGLEGKAQIEFFNGPHKINGKGTFAFLHRYLNWPERND